MSRSEDFGNTPFLLSSNVSNNERVWNEVYTDDGECFDDDVFFLVTDALAHWFLTQKELGNKPWNQLLGVETQEDFTCFVHRLRQERLLRNDDTTLLIVRLMAKSTQPLNISQGTDKHETIGIQDELA